jgi:hypothetical protein
MSEPSWADCITAIGTAVGALATVVTAGIAWYAAATWRKSLRHASRHDVAKDVLEEARLFRYLLYDARNPFYGAGEFSPSYHATRSEERSAAEEARGYAYIYEARWKLIEPQMLVLATLRARAGAVLDEDVATAHTHLTSEMSWPAVAAAVIQMLDAARTALGRRVASRVPAHC